MNTRCGSCVTPIAATCDRPVAAALSRQGFMTSMLRSAAFSVTTGMWLAPAKEATRRRKASPICCRHAGGRDWVPAVLEELDHLAADL